MKTKVSISLVAIMLFAFTNLGKTQFNAKSIICYEESITIGSIFNIPTGTSGMEISILNGAGISVYSSYLPVTSTFPLNFNTISFLENKKYGTDTTLTIKVVANNSVNQIYNGTKTFTFARGYDPAFNLPSEISIIKENGYPLSTPINLVDYTNSGKNAGSKFTSSTATIENDTLWNFRSLLDNKDRWTTNHTVDFYPVKKDGCGINSVSKVTKLVIDFETTTIPEICRHGDSINLLFFIKKPLPIEYQNIKYEGKFTCENALNSIIGNYFNPSLVGDKINNLTIGYDYFQRDNSNALIQSKYFSINLNISPDSVNADFTISDAKPTTVQSVDFSAIFVGAKSYTWNFGDGRTENQQNVSNIYNTEGSYNVTLTVESTGGCTARQTRKSGVVVSNSTTLSNRNIENLSIWPQPVSNELHINLADITQAELTITELSGKTILTREISQEDNTFDISGFNKGIFVIRITTADKVYVGKFIKE